MDFTKATSGIIFYDMHLRDKTSSFNLIDATRRNNNCNATQQIVVLITLKQLIQKILSERKSLTYEENKNSQSANKKKFLL